MKIHFWDNPSEHNERNSFRSKLSNYGIRSSIDQQDLKDISLVFIHGSDDVRLNEFSFGKDIFKVIFGGNPTNVRNIDSEDNKISYINAGELCERFDSIIENLKKSPSFNLEKLSEIVFGFDPTLEQALKFFELVNPLEKSEEELISLKKLKNELQEYVSKKLEEKTKPKCE